MADFLAQNPDVTLLLNFGGWLVFAAVVVGLLYQIARNTEPPEDEDDG